MKLFLCFVFVVAACAALHAQPANNAAFGSTVTIWSSHTTVRQRIDSGVNEQIELWNRSWIVSPSGVTFANTANYGLGGTDGFSTTTVTLNETGRWSWWTTDAGAIDSFTFGDRPGSWYMFPHNPPNGVGYGGAGTALGSFIDVQSPPPANRTLTTSVIGNGSVSGAGTYTHGTIATVSATPGSGHAFSGWQGALSGGTNPASLTMDSDKSITAVFTALNTAPTIAWVTAPGTVSSGQGYTITAHGHDADGNLAQVNVWKNGAPFAFLGGGNGYDNDGGNPTSDTGPATITFTANAVDANGAASTTISQTVTVRAANNPPTIAWTSTPGTVASGASYTVSARGHDADGNLAQVNIWKNGVGFAFAGGGNGTDGDSSNPTSDTGPATISFAANAVDANGAASGTISQTVTISAPPVVSASIAVSPSTTNAPGATTVSWTSTNASSVSVSGPGLSSTLPSASQNVSGLGVGTHTFTVTAQGNGGPITRFATVTVNSAPSVSATISASPATATAPGSTTVTWSSANASSVQVTGTGLGSTAAAGTETVNGLPAGTHTYTITAQGPNGPAVQTATITVAAPATVSASISASPTSTTAPGTATISWSSANATAVAVSGPSLSTTAAGGSQVVTGLATGTHTYTITAQGPGGPATQSATVVVSSPSAVDGAISASPSSGTAPLSTFIAWSTTNATSVAVNGPGLASTSAGGAQTVPALGVGTHTFTLTAQGPGGPITRTATVTVSAVTPTVSGSIAASPTTSTAPGTTTISWTTNDATAVNVSGPGVTSALANGSAIATGLAAGTHTYTLTAQGNGGPITRTVSVIVTAAPPTRIVTVAISPPGAGSATGAGAYPQGNVATLTAAPATNYAFTGWTGNIVSTANPLSFAVTGDAALVANFTLVNFTLTTAATTGGSVTPGGTYPAGSIVTLTASPDATHRFASWTGDASGTAPSVAVTLDRSKFVQANFAAKSSQTIAFAAPADRAVTSPPFTLSATASSGLPVSFALLGGPASLSGSTLQLTGPGPITLRASQAGDALYLPAPDVTHTFNATAQAIVKYRGAARTLLRDGTTREAPPYVVETP